MAMYIQQKCNKSQ